MRDKLLRKLIIYNCLLLWLILFTPTLPMAYSSIDEQSIIIEVDGDPHLHQRTIEAKEPFIKVIAVYDTLFNGLAVQAKEKHLRKLQQLPFVKSIYDVYTYVVDVKQTSITSKRYDLITTKQTNFPETINDTHFTGKGVKVGVIDTGIDYDHPSLIKNFKGGYDVVDFDDDPKETLPSEGMPTLHGTHVAGIIAADGQLKGVAPGADIYAYRALGPGGVGTSIQVIAALEEAVKDGMDIINLSLGNSINGPDVPTSIAVDRAHKLGAIVVTANGNDGPANWTVGSPATATNSISVGALAPETSIYVLRDKREHKEISLSSIPYATPWVKEGRYEIVHLSKVNTKRSLHGKVAFITDITNPLDQVVDCLMRKGAQALLIEQTALNLVMDMDIEQLPIPVIPLSKTNSEWLLGKLAEGPYIGDIEQKTIATTVAPFSSRGPVTVDWTIKPDLLAPGTKVLSTIPGGYQELQGTSMAAPHVAGSLALIKEAHPDWTKEQMINALKTTAHPLVNHLGEVLSPTVQGMGVIQVKDAITTDTIIYDPLLSLGKTTANQQVIKKGLTLENMTNREQTYSFNMPKQMKGYKWHLPQTFTLQPFEKKTIPLELSIHPLHLEAGIYQGYLTLQKNDDSYHLPYLFVHETFDHPLLMGFALSLQPFSMEEYMYQFYLTENIKSLQVDLFNADTLRFQKTLLTSKDLSAGLHKGELSAAEMPDPGYYKAQFTIETEDGETKTFEQEMAIE